MDDIRIPTRTELPTEMSKISLPLALLTILGDWLLIFAAIGLATAYSNAITFIMAQLIIASRQHALFLIMHEATHYLLCKNRIWNDRISNLLASWPVGFSTERYRLRHWTHHRYLNTDKDPDWARKKDDRTWQFPMPHGQFWRASLPHLLGKGALEMAYAFRGIGIEKKDLPQALPYYAFIASVITVAGAWSSFALYWLLPYFTILPFLHRVRNASEHLALPKTHALNGSRDIVGSSIESFFFGPHNASLHLVHHAYPFIPWYRLKTAHSLLLLNPQFSAHAYENTGYFLPTGKDVYRDMTTIKSAAQSEKMAA